MSEATLSIEAGDRARLSEEVGWLILENGRIVGVSGLLGALILPRPCEWRWRARRLGLIVARFIARFLFAPAAPVIEANAATLNPWRTSRRIWDASGQPPH
jgi:hypothetical protein